MTITQAINAFSDKGIATHEIVIDDEYEDKADHEKKSLEERMQELQVLYDKGLITSAEYESKRKNILDEI